MIHQRHSDYDSGNLTKKLTFIEVPSEYVFKLQKH